MRAVGLRPEKLDPSRAESIESALLSVASTIRAEIVAPPIPIKELTPLDELLLLRRGRLGQISCSTRRDEPARGG